MTVRVGATEQLLTTDPVVGETWTFLRRKDTHRTAVAFVDRVDAFVELSKVVVHRVTDEQIGAALAWLRRRDERGYSYVDATSFRVMRDRRLHEALAFDGDFVAAGFVEVQP